MGYTAHHAIIVTGWRSETVHLAHTKAVDLGCLVTPVIASRVNDYYSFAVLPDGSKEGWPDSDIGDQQRKELLEWIDEYPGYLDFIEVRFGGDDSDMAAIMRHNE